MLLAALAPKYGLLLILTSRNQSWTTRPHKETRPFAVANFVRPPPSGCRAGAWSVRGACQ